jgi:hypothetical protein
MTSAMRLLFAMAAAGAAAAPATAAAAPIAPQVETGRFTVAVKATQTTTWKQVPGASARDCTASVRFSGSGTERVKARTLHPYALRATRAGDQLALALAITAKEPQALLVGTVDRQASTSMEEVAGSCGDNAGGTTAGGPYDCGTQNRRWGFVLAQGRGRVGLTVVEELLTPLTGGPQSFETCPLYAVDKVAQAGITNGLEKLGAAELFHGPRVQELTSDRTYRLSQGGITGRTRVTWTITLTRR